MSEHTRKSTESGPDFCAECSAAIQDWVTWPCRALDDDLRCQNCGRDIRRPERGSYPPGVEWVHVLSPLGPGNRYCDTSGSLAAPTKASA